MEIRRKRGSVCVKRLDSSAMGASAGGKRQGRKACERLRSRPKGADQSFQAGREISESATRLPPSSGDLGGSSQVLESQGRATFASSKRRELRAEGDRRCYPFFPKEMDRGKDRPYGHLSSRRLGLGQGRRPRRNEDEAAHRVGLPHRRDLQATPGRPFSRPPLEPGAAEPPWLRPDP